MEKELRGGQVVVELRRPGSEKQARVICIHMVCVGDDNAQHRKIIVRITLRGGAKERIVALHSHRWCEKVL